MKLIGKFLILVILTSCIREQFTLEDYANYPVKYTKQKITYPNNDFEIMIPHDWKWKVEQHEDERIILQIDASSEPDEDGFIDIISIQKIKGFSKNNDIKSEYNALMAMREDGIGPEMVDTGNTDFLDNSYFIHSKSSTGKYGEVEIINILKESDEKGIFYVLTASASQTKNLKLNMAMMLNCLRTFNYKLEN